MDGWKKRATWTEWRGKKRKAVRGTGREGESDPGTGVGSWVMRVGRREPA